MIYNSLEILPIKVFFKILNTDDLKLLTNENISEEDLRALWESLYEDYKKLNPNNEINKNLFIIKKIEELNAKYKSVIIAIQYLIEKEDNELIKLLQSYNYKLSRNTFNEDLERIERESRVVLTKIQELKLKLPNKSNTGSLNISIDDILAGYSLILGFDFDYNAISVTKFFALQNQVKLKTKALEKNG